MVLLPRDIQVIVLAILTMAILTTTVQARGRRPLYCCTGSGASTAPPALLRRARWSRSARSAAAARAAAAASFARWVRSARSAAAARWAG
eukprot:scaffold49261_cov62-Phaeocystis_antarctica.AAC.4